MNDVLKITFGGLLEDDACRLAHALHYHGHCVVVDDGTSWAVDFTAYRDSERLYCAVEDVTSSKNQGGGDE